MEERHRIAVFIDFDNIEIGVKNTLRRDFDVSPVLEALKERGEILTKIAYGDWTRHGQMSRSLSQHGVQMVQRHPGPRGDKNGADINLALDALEMALTKPHIDAFAIVSGDSDFISLVEKLKQYNKTIYVVGGRAFTSTILQKNCREFISYETLLTSPTPPSQRHGRSTTSQRAQQRPAAPSGPTLPLSHVAPLLYRTMEVLQRREVTPQLGLLKSTLQQLDSSFTERDYGAGSFRQFVEMLQKAGMLELKKVDSQFIVELPQAEEAAPPTDTLLRPEDALPALYQALKVIDENDLWGQLDMNGVKNYVIRLVPDFDEHKYGFGQFAEVLTYAQDVGLARLEPDAQGVLRVLPGIQFTPTRPMVAAPSPKAAAAEPPAAMEAVSDTLSADSETSFAPAEGGQDEKPATADKPRRRSYRRRSRKPATPKST
jgi:uncharacterized protein (TIGR00288 family)